MRVLIDPGSHHLLNLGDVSMLHICAERLRDHSPGARVQVLTQAPERLALHCPGVEPLDARGRYLWSERPPRLPRRRELARRRLAWGARRLARSEPAARAFVDALLHADLLLMSGRGGLTDAFPSETEAVLSEVEAAHRIGVPVALLGQGVGPLEDPALRARARAVLPDVALLAVREGRAAPGLLEELGVPAERVAVTGDDAIELAYERRPAEVAPSGAVGVNMRVAEYSGLSLSDAEEAIAHALAAAERHGAPIEAIEISNHPYEDDGETLAAALGGDPPARPDGTEATPITVPIDKAGRCRVVVSGSYHAAVFALAQGIPAVGIACSPYYVDKFLGLREQFGDACRVVRLTESGGLDAIGAQVDELWELAPAVRPELLAAAERQIALSRDACARAIAIAAGGAPRRKVTAEEAAALR